MSGTGTYAMLSHFSMDSDGLRIHFEQIYDGGAVQPNILRIEPSLLRIRAVKKHLQVEALYFVRKGQPIKPMNVDEPKASPKAEILLKHVKTRARIGVRGKKSVLRRKPHRCDPAVAPESR
jgi:hypothetical protein